MLAILAVLSVGDRASATWSIVAVDPDTGEVGVAVASCVGFEVTVVPVLVPGVGAAASQANISSASGDRLLAAMVPGADAADVVDVVVAADDAPDDRQFGAVVIDGGGAGWSGSDTFAVSLDARNATGTAAAQGNILVSGDVVAATLAAFETAPGDLADRLLAGLLAGADAGGDGRCGPQTATAAALMVAAPTDEPYAATDGGFLGVDPDSVAVPSTFVSVLVNEGADRAPDRLAREWERADRAGPVSVRVIDDGADTAASQVRRVVLVASAALGGCLVLIGVGIVRARRRNARP